MNIYIPKWLIKFVLCIVALIVACKIIHPIGVVLVLILYIWIKTESTKKSSSKKEDDKKES